MCRQSVEQILDVSENSSKELNGIPSAGKILLANQFDESPLHVDKSSGVMSDYTGFGTEDVRHIGIFVKQFHAEELYAIFHNVLTIFWCGYFRISRRSNQLFMKMWRSQLWYINHFSTSARSVQG